MLELSQRRRLCCRIIARRSSRHFRWYPSRMMRYRNLGNTKLQGTDPRDEREVPVAVAIGRPFQGAFVTPRRRSCPPPRSSSETASRCRRSPSGNRRLRLREKRGKQWFVLGHRCSGQVEVSQLWFGRPIRWLERAVTLFEFRFSATTADEPERDPGDVIPPGPKTRHLARSVTRRIVRNGAVRDDARRI